MGGLGKCSWVLGIAILKWRQRRGARPDLRTRRFAGGLLANLYLPVPTLTAPPEAVVRAKRFQVIDDQGRVTAELSPAGLDLLGQDGRVRATLRLMYNDKGVLAFSDAKWEGRALFGFLGTDTPSMKDDDWGLHLDEQPGQFSHLITHKVAQRYPSNGHPLRMLRHKQCGRRTRSSSTSYSADLPPVSNMDRDPKLLYRLLFHFR